MRVDAQLLLVATTSGIQRGARAAFAWFKLLLDFLYSVNNNFLDVGLDIASAAFFASEVVVNLKCLLTSSSMLFRLRCEC